MLQDFITGKATIVQRHATIRVPGAGVLAVDLSRGPGEAVPAGNLS